MGLESTPGSSSQAVEGGRGAFLYLCVPAVLPYYIDSQEFQSSF